ncbi:MAG: M20/M25/M40 family metallo-hydrolase [Candidatus Levybacteria bacterium]|nr:M20/M25/M40 family metallo-hydrolase [Candidatus Levybacteria bacterium]
MLNKIVNLTKEFVSVKSNSDNPAELDKILEIALSNLKEFTIERFTNKGVKSALVYNSKKRPSKFRIILNGHLDVIPGKDYQYSPKIKNDKLYGVGSMDMKASVACLIMVFKEVAEKVDYHLALQLVTDEEIGGFNGTKFQIEKGVKADFVIAGESTGLQIANRAKGILQVKISTKGKTAHGAYPWKGKNAIWKMNQFLNSLLKKYPIPSRQEWVTTVNLSRIKTTNTSLNKIPDDCEILLDIRYVPEEADTIVNDIKEFLPKGFKMDIFEKEPSLFVDDKNQYLKMLQSVVKQTTKKKVRFYGAQGSSDARHFTRVCIDGIEFGPIGGGIGTDNEWVSIESIKTYYDILKTFLLKLK